MEQMLIEGQDEEPFSTRTE